MATKFLRVGALHWQECGARFYFESCVIQRRCSKLRLPSTIEVLDRAVWPESIHASSTKFSAGLVGDIGRTKLLFSSTHLMVDWSGSLAGG